MTQKAVLLLSAALIAMPVFQTAQAESRYSTPPAVVLSPDLTTAVDPSAEKAGPGETKDQGSHAAAENGCEETQKDLAMDEAAKAQCPRYRHFCGIQYPSGTATGPAPQKADCLCPGFHPGAQTKQCTGCRLHSKTGCPAPDRPTFSAADCQL